MLEPWEGRKALDTHFLYLLSKRARKHVLSSSEPKRQVRGSHGLGNCAGIAPFLLLGLMCSTGCW